MERKGVRESRLWWWWSCLSLLNDVLFYGNVGPPRRVPPRWSRLERGTGNREEVASKVMVLNIGHCEGDGGGGTFYPFIREREIDK